MAHPASALLLVVLAQAHPSKPGQTPSGKPAQAAPPPPVCDGDYADALPAATASRAFDTRGDPFVFAIRNTATYEHVYYGRDGKLRKEYLRTVVHGTGPDAGTAAPPSPPSGVAAGTRQ
jgi:hypothetical protein